MLDEGAGANGSCPRSVLGVTSGGAGGGAIGATGFGRAIVTGAGDGAGRLGAAFTGAAFFTAAFLAADFLGAAFFAADFFGAAFLALRATFALLAFFAGRAFLFGTLLLAAARLALAFALGRFFPFAFFFAMVCLLLGFDPIVVRVADALRVALKKSAVICAMLESTRRIAYAADVMPNDPIRPLHDVWLRPRRVFRELAMQPVGRLDLLLGAAQGVGDMLFICRAQNFGATFPLAPIFVAAALAGPIAGIVSLYVMSAIYARLASGSGSANVRGPLIHVLAYGGVPMAVWLGTMLLTALIAGDATFLATPRAEDEGFISILLSAQFISYFLLAFWSVVLQTMGFSEVLKLTVTKAIVIWVLGRLVLILGTVFLGVIARLLAPGT